MLSRSAIAGAVLLGLAHSAAEAAERDYMQRGEEELTADYEIEYNRAVRHVLARAWHKDVAVRVVDIPPFEPERAQGIARTSVGYKAFDVRASKHIWSELGFGSVDLKQKKADHRSIRPVLHERPISDALAARIAAIWRRVLADSRNYGKDNSIFLDTNQFTYHVSFLPGERLTAHVTGWGPRSEQLIYVGGALASYANGGSERDLLKDVAKAEKKLGI